MSINAPDDETSNPIIKTDEDDEDHKNEIVSRFGDALFPLINRFGYEGINFIGILIARLKQEDRQAALYLMEKSPAIIERLLSYGEDLVLNIYSLANQMISFGPLLPVRFLEMSPRIMEKDGYETLVRTASLMAEVAGVHTATAVSLTEKSPDLIEAIGFDGLEKVAGFIAVIASSSWIYALKEVESSLSIIKQLKDQGGQPLVLAVYSLGAHMAADDWNCALEFVRNSPVTAGKLISRISLEYLLGLYEQANLAIPFKAKLTQTLFDAAPLLLNRLGPTGLDSIRRCAMAIAADDWERAVTLIKESPDRIEGLLSHIHPDQANEIYELGSKLTGSGSEIDLLFIVAGLHLAGSSRHNDVKELAALTQMIADISRKAAEAFLKAVPSLFERIDQEGIRQVVELIVPIAKESWETASQLFLKSPELIDRLGLEGLRLIAGFSAFLARESWSTAVQFLDKCPHILDELLKLGDASLVSDVCRIGRRAAQTNARLAVSLVSRSPEIIKMNGFESLQKVEELALQIGPESWTAAVSLVEASPLFLERVGYQGLERISAVARSLARENSFVAVSLLEKGPGLIDRLLTVGNNAQALHVYDLVGEAAQSNWRLASPLLEKSPELLSKLGAEGLERLFVLVIQAAKVNGQIATRLLDLSPIMLNQIGFEGLETVTGFISSLAVSDWMAALSVLEKSPLLIDRLGQTKDWTLVSKVYDLAAKIAHTSPAVAMKLLEKSPDFLEWLGLEGFGKLAAFLENTAREDEEKALSFLAGDSSSLSDFLENIPKGLELKTIKPILSTYLKALLGRRVEVDEAGRVYTDGKKIYLPGRIREFQEQADNFTYYKVAATHQEAHLEYGSFEFDLDRINDCTKRIGSLFGLKAMEGESDMERFIRLFPEPDLARDLFNLMEDWRIEKILKWEYPALGEEISRMNIHQVSKRSSPRKMTNPKQRIVEMIGQSLMAKKTFPEVDDQTLAVLKKAQEGARVLEQPTADVHRSARTALDLYLMIHERFKEPYRPVKPMSKPLDQDKVAQNIGSFGKTSQQIQDRIQGRQSAGSNRPKVQPEAESGSEGETQPTTSRPSMENIQQRPHQAGKEQRTFRGPAGGGKQESGDPDSEAEETGRVGEAMKFDSREKIERLLRALYREKGITPKEIERRLESLHQNEIYLFLHNLEASLAKKTELQTERGTSLYPEWGEDINDYRGNWARIREQTLTGRSFAFYRQALDKHAGLLKKIRREFQMLKPEGFTKRKRQYDGDDIDLDAVVENWVDRKVGLSPTEKNYTLHQKKKRDIAVAFLVDMSRSTKGPTIELEKEALIIMSEALNEVGDVFAVFGFSGDNRDNVDFYRIKDFDDPYDQQVKKRISAIADRFENRDGAAIRHTISKLRMRAERTKMLILLSDGKPVDKEYSGTYAIEDTRLALKEARHFGIKTFCITVDLTAAEYLPRMYSHSSWTVIDEVSKLPEKITRIYRMLTT